MDAGAERLSVAPLRLGVRHSSLPRGRFGRLLRLKSVRHLARFRVQPQLRSTRLELEERGKIDVAQAVPDQADDDLVGERRDRQGNVELARGVQSQFKVLSQEVAGEGRREVEAD